MPGFYVVKIASAQVCDPGSCDMTCSFLFVISCLERPGDWGCEVESYFQAKKKWIFKLFIDTRPKVIDQILGKNKNAEVNVVNSSPIFHESSHPNTGKLYFYQVMCVWSGDHFL